MFIIFMRFFSIATLLISSILFSLLSVAEELPSNNTTPPHKKTATDVTLPPLPEGMSELSFNEFFKMPIGPRGLEPTEKLLSLNNKHVRVIGYMAKEEEPTPGLFMLAAYSINVAEKADGVADDLPAATLFVHMPPKDKDMALAYRPTPWVLTGTLQLGNQEENNGRVSFVRLILEQGDIDVVQKKKH